VSDTNGGQTVTLGGEEIPLRLPPSPALRLDIYYAGSTNLDRAGCAALGASWHGEAALRAKYARCRHKPLDYGGQVLDELLARGLPYREILAAGGAAYIALAVSVRPFLDDITAEEVEAAEDFTEGPAASGSG